MAYDHPHSSLTPHDYKPILGTVGLWEYESGQAKFCVYIDDFGIKYWSKEDADHLCNSLSKKLNRPRIMKEKTTVVSV